MNGIHKKNSEVVCTSIRLGDSQTGFWLHLNYGGLVVKASPHVARLYVNGLVPNHKELTLRSKVTYYRLGMSQIATFKPRVTQIKRNANTNTNQTNSIRKTA